MIPSASSCMAVSCFPKTWSAWRPVSSPLTRSACRGAVSCSIPWEMAIWGSTTSKACSGYPASVSSSHRMAEAGGTFGDCLVQLHQDQLLLAAQDWIQLGSVCPQGWRPHSLSNQGVSHTPCKKAGHRGNASKCKIINIGLFRFSFCSFFFS